jgi:hypothetical protein
MLANAAAAEVEMLSPVAAMAMAGIGAAPADPASRLSTPTLSTEQASVNVASR